jgi:hypothetical protein
MRAANSGSLDVLQDGCPILEPLVLGQDQVSKADADPTSYQDALRQGRRNGGKTSGCQ